MIVRDFREVNPNISCTYHNDQLIECRDRVTGEVFDHDPNTNAYAQVMVPIARSLSKATGIDELTMGLLLTLGSAGLAIWGIASFLGGKKR